MLPLDTPAARPQDGFIIASGAFHLASSPINYHLTGAPTGLADGTRSNPLRAAGKLTNPRVDLVALDHNQDLFSGQRRALNVKVAAQTQLCEAASRKYTNSLPMINCC